jgi:hypothetical protein
MLSYQQYGDVPLGITLSFMWDIKIPNSLYRVVPNGTSPLFDPGIFLKEPRIFHELFDIIDFER